MKPTEEIYDAKFDPVKGPRNEQLNEDLPFGSRAGCPSALFPGRRRIRITLRFVADLLSPVNGFAELPTADVHVVKKFVPAGLHTIGAAAPRTEPEGGDRSCRPARAVLAAAGTPGRSNQVVMDLFLDRERLKRFDLSTGPSTPSRMIIARPLQHHGPRRHGEPREDFHLPSRRRPLRRPACARRILTNLAHRAFRRPVTKADIDPLYAFYQTARTGGDFDSGIEAALRAMLVSPEFLFRIEQDPARAQPGQVARASATWIWPLGCRSFCGAASPTTNCSAWPSRAH